MTAINSNPEEILNTLASLSEFSDGTVSFTEDNIFFARSYFNLFSLQGSEYIRPLVEKISLAIVDIEGEEKIKEMGKLLSRANTGLEALKRKVSLADSEEIKKGMEQILNLYFCLEMKREDGESLDFVIIDQNESELGSGQSPSTLRSLGQAISSPITNFGRAFLHASNDPKDVGWKIDYYEAYIKEIGRILANHSIPGLRGIEKKILKNGKKYSDYYEMHIFFSQTLITFLRDNPSKKASFCYRLFTEININPVCVRVVRTFADEVKEEFPNNLITIRKAIAKAPWSQKEPVSYTVARGLRETLLHTDPNTQGDLFHRLYSLNVNKKVVHLLAFAAPFIHTTRKDPEVTPEFKGFILGSIERGKQHLIIGNEDFKDPLISLMKDPDMQDSNARPAVFVVILPKKTSFYLQGGLKKGSAKQFIANFEEKLLESDEYYFPDLLKNKTLFKSILNEVYVHVFEHKDELTIEEKRLFIDIVHDQLVKLALNISKVDTLNFSCKTGSSVGAISSASFYYSLLIGHELGVDQGSQEILEMLPFARPLLVKQKPPSEVRLERLVAMFNHLKDKSSHMQNLHLSVFINVEMYALSEVRAIVSELNQLFEVDLRSLSLLKEVLENSEENRIYFKKVFRHLIEQKSHQGAKIKDNGFAFLVNQQTDPRLIPLVFTLWEQSLASRSIDLNLVSILNRFTLAEIISLNGAFHSKDYSSLSFLYRAEKELFPLLAENFKPQLDKAIASIFDIEVILVDIQSYLGEYNVIDKKYKNALRTLLKDSSAQKEFQDLLLSYKALREHNLALLRKGERINENDGPHLEVSMKAADWDQTVNYFKYPEEATLVLILTKEIGERATLMNTQIHRDSLANIVMPFESCRENGFEARAYTAVKIAIKESEKEIDTLLKKLTQENSPEEEKRIGQKLAFLRSHREFNGRHGRLNVLESQGWNPIAPTPTEDTIEEFVKNSQPFCRERVITFTLPNGPTKKASATLDLRPLGNDPFSRNELVSLFQSLAVFGTEKFEARLESLTFLNEAQSSRFITIAEKFDKEIEVAIALALLTL